MSISKKRKKISDLLREFSYYYLAAFFHRGLNLNSHEANRLIKADVNKIVALINLFNFKCCKHVNVLDVYILK